MALLHSIKQGFGVIAWISAWLSKESCQLMRHAFDLNMAGAGRTVPQNMNFSPRYGWRCPVKLSRGGSRPHSNKCLHLPSLTVQFCSRTCRESAVSRHGRLAAGCSNTGLKPTWMDRCGKSGMFLSDP